MRRLRFITLLTFFVNAGVLHAQRGAVAIGFRATPDGGGVTGRIFLDRNLALEGQINAGGIFNLDGESITAVGMLQYHLTLPEPSWRVFFGGGVHFGSWNNRPKDEDDFIIGIDGIGGVEYYFKNIPISVSADFKPAINLVEDVEFFPHNIFGFAARYNIGR